MVRLQHIVANTASLSIPRIIASIRERKEKARGHGNCKQYAEDGNDSLASPRKVSETHPITNDMFVVA